ncbi:hypothetical protein E0G06_14205 [Salmonella enterica]|nr:hypothetical protein [Salmonella enterica]EAT3568269.1 hypothetical protein [Salmonella enterica]EDX9922985.1 hypothetical protein [Salmonella enterica]
MLSPPYGATSVRCSDESPRRSQDK